MFVPNLCEWSFVLSRLPPPPPPPATSQTSNAGFNCRLQMQTSNADFNCRLQMQTSSAVFKCRLQMQTSNADFKCRLQVQTSNADFQATQCSMVLEHPLEGACLVLIDSSRTSVSGLLLPNLCKWSFVVSWLPPSSSFPPGKTSNADFKCRLQIT